MSASPGDLPGHVVYIARVEEQDLVLAKIIGDAFGARHQDGLVHGKVLENARGKIYVCEIIEPVGNQSEVNAGNGLGNLWLCFVAMKMNLLLHFQTIHLTKNL